MWICFLARFESRGGWACMSWFLLVCNPNCGRRSLRHATRNLRRVDRQTQRQRSSGQFLQSSMKHNETTSHFGWAVTNLDGSLSQSTAANHNRCIAGKDVATSETYHESHCRRHSQLTRKGQQTVHANGHSLSTVCVT